MNLLEQTKFILKNYNLSINKLRGQNFLISDEILKKIINVSNLKKGENVLEIGPGLGTLTNAILESNVNLISVEVDGNFIPILEKIKSVSNNFQFIREDILKMNLQKQLNKDFLKNYKIVSNIPYNITSRFLRIFLESNFAPREMILMLQKEVAERIVNHDNKWSKLSVMCNFYSDPKIEFYVSKNDFYPSPDVDSAVIKFTNISKNKYNVEEKKFFQIVSIGFSSKRRTLANNLSVGLKLNKQIIENAILNSDLDINIRAEKLNLDNWVKLLKVLN
ncbi:MAG TPA: 16S rRNA (adenine(1518)-N(6)/adenine(1519)-N(6))-dimethyltransferase RsmA [bacterium]|jgi:16S rRNA (adenine1518-N6/adenine1519-N6)-dimethyltransferase|nr:16S rRNA (adenine(1518)-N(6)/adenine(1519)-N(6))-dimethyltransferase RsmA [bacterium]HOG38746.1 16S rRNA (adenine(1518)-N(6)/adenine(1519)-N(6))-dimethyltransferase RsmA [bacterium]HQI03585.1 16S rRNA (adenine(1518)-N(6)/adenine(1519)-N(6))-dimethyltransferase RsmA [bacterium]